ncbi:anti-sigma factor [Cellulosimicrobium sp. PMB13]|uniref:anti-sigma factor n=1 Tax=Cellulosimicrobium sp. PMB13 TaxID=3120158 RepID=UPI003F4B42D8
MQHIDDETLALLALGEDVLDDAARAHLGSCDACTAEVDGLRSVVDDARAGGPDLVAPDPDVWNRVHAELGLGASSTSPAGAGPTGWSGDATTGAGDVATVTPLAGRRRGVWLPVAAAASVALVVGVAGGVWWERRELTPTETTVATADLAPLPGWDDASGEARVEETADGRRQVVVTLDAPAPDGTFREVWLLAEDVSGLVSLGVLEGSEGRFDLPDGLDLTAFPVVDVSEEHFDGDPAHSGDSVVRGPLDV